LHAQGHREVQGSCRQAWLGKGGYLGGSITTPSMRIPFLFLSLAFLTSAFAQNQPPVVTITDAVVDEGAATVTITYDLADAENDPSTVTLRASLDGGTTYAVEVLQVSGDVGGGIQPGTGHSITWNYDGTPNIWEGTVMMVADD